MGVKWMEANTTMREVAVAVAEEPRQESSGRTGS